MSEKRICVTGSQGFIGSYICQELLDHGYFVYGIDNYSKYGHIDRPHDKHKMFRLVNADVLDMEFIAPSLGRIDYLIAGAAMIGGISYFHKYAYDLLSVNEKIMSETFDFCIKKLRGAFKRIVVLSSSMVYENATTWPTSEEYLKEFPPPSSTYGFQKLATEYYCKGAWEQYKLPYTIVRPFNCIGIGEEDFKEGTSHVVPDLVFKALNSKPDDALDILGNGNQVRCYTHGRDIARGVRLAIESEKAHNQDFNISSREETTVKELGTMIWQKIHGCNPDFMNKEPFAYDVQKRIPDVSKAKQLLGFSAEISLDESLNEIIAHMKERMYVK